MNSWNKDVLLAENQIFIETQNINELEQQLAEKDKEIKELKENDRITKALYKNYYTQLQNYKNKLYEIDVKKLMSKKLTPEEKEIYYKGFVNCERQIASNIADITIKIRKQICDEINDYIDELINERFANGEARYLTIDVYDFCEFLDQIEKGEKDE